MCEPGLKLTCLYDLSQKWSIDLFLIVKLRSAAEKPILYLNPIPKVRNYSSLRVENDIGLIQCGKFCIALKIKKKKKQVINMGG